MAVVADPEPRTVRVTVTAADIARGRPYTPDACPVALAIERALGTWATVLVNRVYTTVGRHTVVNPGSVREFVERFDERFPVAPFEFELVLP